MKPHVNAALERFDQYTYGRHVVVRNDHCPLEIILRNPLIQAPKRLQVLIMRLHRYHMDFKYVPGSTLVIANTLSRAFPPGHDHYLRASRVMIVETLEPSDERMLAAVKDAMQNDDGANLL